MTGDEVPTRVRLLQAAVAVLAESGWAAVTSRAVAERARANNALVHYYFGSVDALRRAAVMHAVEMELAAPVEAILRRESVLDGLADAVDVLVGHGSGGAGQRVLVEALVHGVRDDELREECERQIRMFRDLLAERLAANREAGLLRADADPAGLAVLLAALLDGLLLHVMLDPRTDAAGSAAGLLALLRPSGGPPSGTAPAHPTDQGGDHEEP